jgi:hypothetical protein
VQKRNDDRLKAAGVSDAARHEPSFQSHFTATLQTGRAESVAALGEVTG